MAGGMTYTAVSSTKMATAEVFGQKIGEIAAKDKRVVAITADLAKSTKIGDFRKNTPDRFFNVGIAEQNAVGLAAGMALSGLIPFVSLFAQFASLRAADQVSADLCYQNVNVKLIGTHSGTSFGQSGSTHHALNDIALLRTFPNMTVIVPADGIEAGKAVEAIYKKVGPCYLRLNRGFDMVIYKDEKNCKFEIGKANIMVDNGDDLAIIACGSCVYQAMQAASALKADYKINAKVINMHTIKPIDKDAIVKAVEKTRRIITVEDHQVAGGLGSAVSEVIVENGKACAFKRLGLQDKFSAVGLQEDLMSDNEIDSNGIIKTAVEMMKHSKVVDIDSDGKKSKAIKFDNRTFEVDVVWDDEV